MPELQELFEAHQYQVVEGTPPHPAYDCEVLVQVSMSFQQLPAGPKHADPSAHTPGAVQ